MKVGNKKVVSIDFTLKNQDGELIDSSEGQDPLQYVHGVGAIIPGLEKALNGKQAGDKISLTVPPEEAYGDHDQEMIQEIPRDQIDGIKDLEVGMPLEVAASGEGEGEGEDDEEQYFLVTVVKILDDKIIVDGNHPLAGMTLTFDVEVKEIRDATEEELEQGHVCCGGEEEGCGCGHKH